LVDQLQCSGSLSQCDRPLYLAGLVYLAIGSRNEHPDALVCVCLSMQAVSF
jgi:hypothetical protein